MTYPPTPLRPNKTDHRMLAVFIFLSVFELPVVWINSDSIGLFDLYLIVYDVYLVLRTRGFTGPMSWPWRTYFLIFFGYIAYLALLLPLLPDFRSTTIVLKTGETMIIMITFYMVYTRFDFEPKAVARMLVTTGVLLAVFQVGSFFNLFRHVGFQPGLGIGQWYRVGLPFVKGISSDPAGVAAGTFVLFALFARRRKDLGQTGFLLLLVLTTLALVLTVSRTNILSLTGALVVYLLLRSVKRSRYLFALITFVVVLAMAVNILVNSLPQSSGLFLVLDLVRHPQHFFSRVGSDASFAIRYRILWPAEYAAWIRNPLTFFFGNGVGYFPIADNTYLGVLANQGLVGMCGFLFVWYLFFLTAWRSRLPFLSVTLLFLLVGGLTGDTLVTSYRTIQVYLPILFFFFYAYGGLRDNHDGVGHRALL